MNLLLKPIRKQMKNISCAVDKDYPNGIRQSKTQLLDDADYIADTHAHSVSSNSSYTIDSNISPISSNDYSLKAWITWLFGNQNKNNIKYKVGPGIYAELGYYMLSKGNREEANRYFAKEISLFPESNTATNFISK